MAAALEIHASARRPLSYRIAVTNPYSHTVNAASPGPQTVAVTSATAPRNTPAGNVTGRTSPRRARQASPTSVGFRPYSKAEVQALIRHHAAAYGIDASLPLAIAQCESGFKWNAANPESSARGVFQYVSGTWRATREGRKGTSVFDTEAHVKMAVAHIATLGTAAWNASRGCWDSAATALSSEVTEVFGAS